MFKLLFFVCIGAVTMAHTGQPRWSGAMDCAVSLMHENPRCPTTSDGRAYLFYPTALYILHHMNVLYLNQSNMQLRFSLLLRNIFTNLNSNALVAFV